MPKLITREIQSIHEFTDFIEKELQPEKKLYWYRGVDKAKYGLVPRLFRPNKEISELIKLEREMVNWFYERSIPHCTRELTNNWEKLFFMQHYGVPTRLLDWTESPLIALYFAIEPKKHIEGQEKQDKQEKDAAVWILDPRRWNKSVSRNFRPGGFEAIFSKDDGLHVLDGYELRAAGEGGELLPVAMNGTYNSYRIAAQSGVFTVFGPNKTSMEGYFQEDRNGFNDGCLSKLIIPFEKKDDMFALLLAWGITESRILPDLDGLARETRRFFGFGDQDG